jgi:isopentenyl-diphosphate delta-isomerase type 1
MEYVVLVDEENNPIGTCPKNTVHGAETPLHRGFSVFLFDRHGRVLMQQRSAEKKTWPLVWSNACCGHPGIGETGEMAVQRRLTQELGISSCRVTEILPDYRYRAEFRGVVENEYCPVYVGWLCNGFVPNPHEVAATTWIYWDHFLQELAKYPAPGKFQDFTVWSKEEAMLLNQNSLFQQLWRENVKLSSDGVESTGV